MGLFDKLRKRKESMYLYTEEELNAYEKFIEEQFGDYKDVFHEIVSPDIHLDIIIVPPTDRNPYYKLITMGMGAFKMNVPKELNDYHLERAELVLYLPPTWELKSNEEVNYWPIRQLKVLGRLPIQCDTWLGYGHTVSSDEKNTPFASNTGFCTTMLLKAFNKHDQQLDFTLPGKGKINFYQLFPIYEEELNYKEKTNAEALLDLFEENDKNPVINIDRKNYGIKQ